MKQKSSLIFLFAYLTLFGLSSYAQPKTSGIYLNVKREGNRTSLLPADSAIKTVQLPFFDNFINLGTDLSPTSSNWLKNSGVKISNSLNKNLPDWNAAVFDGTDYQFIPYTYGNPNKRGITDTLTSCYIDLSQAAKIGDSVLCLSFFVQNGGYAEIADGREGDQFKLYFKDNQGKWVLAWSRIDSIPTLNDTLLIDSYYKDFFKNTYKSRLFLNSFDDSVNYLKTVYPTLLNYLGTDKVLQDSMLHFYQIWTGEEVFRSQEDSLNYYRKIYKNDLDATINYKLFFENVYKRKLSFVNVEGTSSDSINYFKKIYPEEFFATEYYKYFFGVKKDPNFKQLPVLHKNFTKSPIVNEEVRAALKRDSILYHRAIVQNQLQTKLNDFTRYDYYFDTIRDAKFFHEKFQLKFQSQGRQSGSFDIWGLDYVFLRKDALSQNRKIANIQDLAVSGIPASPFEGYTSIPLNQISSNYKLRDSIHALSYVFLRDYNEKGPSEAIGAGFSEPKAGTFLNKKIQEPIYKDNDYVSYSLKCPDFNFQDVSQSVARVESFIFIDSSKYVYTRNDTIKSAFEFSNYFAYDDGSAERTFYLSGTSSELAYRYFVANEDTLTHLRFFYPKIIKSNEGRTFSIKIWSNISKSNMGRRNDTLLFSKIVSIDYSEAKDSLNGFVEYKLDSILLVKDTIFVGFEMLSSEPIYFGYDLNPSVSSSQHIFYNSNGYWRPFESRIGNLMIRPVLGKFEGNRNERKGEDNINTGYGIYPNPVDIPMLNIEGPKPVYVKIFDLSGQELQDFTYNHETGIVNVSNLSDGFYTMKIIGPKYVSYKKFIIE